MRRMNTRLAFARTLYVIVGTVALLAAIAPFGVSATNGCTMVFDQGPMFTPTDPTCTSFINPAATASGLVIGGLALAAAFWFGSSHRTQRLVSRVGMVVGAVMTLTPALLLLSNYDFSRVSLDLADYLVMLAPLVPGVLAALTLWRAGTNTKATDKQRAVVKS
jgi:hypothetical protein